MAFGPIRGGGGLTARPAHSYRGTTVHRGTTCIVGCSDMMETPASLVIDSVGSIDAVDSIVVILCMHDSIL